MKREDFVGGVPVGDDVAEPVSAILAELAERGSVEVSTVAGWDEVRRGRGRPPKPPGERRRAGRVEVQFTAAELEVIDAARGDEPVGPWLRRVALAAAQG